MCFQHFSLYLGDLVACTGGNKDIWSVSRRLQDNIPVFNLALMENLNSKLSYDVNKFAVLVAGVSS